jgi:hypothetical protein
MFDPIATDDTYESDGLGLWKPYILEYYWTPQLHQNNYFSNTP